MTITELNELIFNKTGVHAYVDGTMNALRFHYQGNTYRVNTDLFVKKVEGACLVSDSDTQQLEKLLRGEQWDGTGLPPVGTECEWFDSSSKEGWTKVRVMYLSRWVIVMRSIEENVGFGVDISRDLILDKLQELRPLRTERDKAIEQIIEVRSNYGPRTSRRKAAAIYDAIVAGKIDGLGKVG